MFKKLGLTFVAILMLATAAFGGVSAADTSEDVPPAPIADGRLNAYDAAAPVIVYELHETIWDEDENGWPIEVDVISAVQVMIWNQDAEAAYEVFQVSVDDIEAMIADAITDDVVLAQTGGYSLNYSDDGSFWVSAPSLSGGAYTFTWEKNF
ncbi:MAG: hypothetical protein IPK19_37570 [Chloroflexi bacterium]|nr:hypothetical protein [Chloroflexota bacterium]